MKKGHRAVQGGRTNMSGMGTRGVTRPMDKMKKQDGTHDPQASPGDRQHGEDDDGLPHDMSRYQRERMLHMHHMQTLWIYWTVILLGAWMVMSPLTNLHPKRFWQ